jgi:Uma2 family endonuclease
VSIQIINQQKERVRVRSNDTDEAPPLHSGDRLSRAEFERRYEAHPEIQKAELIEGVVYVSSPVRHKQHSKPHGRISGWLYTYHASTPGTDMGDNGTVRLDDMNEVQPDAFLRLETNYGGGSVNTGDDYIEGPPELIVEIAASSAAYDLHDKKQVYARNGVKEYLVAQAYEKQMNWFILRGGTYEILKPDEQGIIRSETLPGLWLQPTAIWSDDPADILKPLQEGLASAEHQSFVATLKAVAGN